MLLLLKVINCISSTYYAIVGFIDHISQFLLSRYKEWITTNFSQVNWSEIYLHEIQD